MGYGFIFAPQCTNFVVMDALCFIILSPWYEVTVIFLIPISDAGLKNKRAGHGDLNDPCVRFKRDCVGIMAAFRLKDPSHFIIVANTHIYWYVCCPFFCYCNTSGYSIWKLYTLLTYTNE